MTDKLFNAFSKFLSHDEQDLLTDSDFNDIDSLITSQLAILFIRELRLSASLQTLSTTDNATSKLESELTNLQKLIQSFIQDLSKLRSCKISPSPQSQVTIDDFLMAIAPSDNLFSH